MERSPGAFGQEAHEREHGLGGLQELGVGDIVDDVYLADAGWKDEGASAAAGFLVGGGERDELRGAGPEAGKRAVTEDRLLDVRSIFARDRAAMKGEVGCGDGAPADGLAVEELRIVGGGFDGVTEGVAEVEDHAQAGFALIGGDHFGFDLRAGEDDARDGGDVLRVRRIEDDISVSGEMPEELGRADDACLDGLLEAGAEFACGKGGEGVRIRQDGERVVKAADEVLAGAEVDAGLAADGGVDLGEQRRWELHVVDAAHVDGGEKAGDVPDDAAAERKQEGVAVGACGGELAGESFKRGETLVGLACRCEESSGRGLAGKGCQQGV